MKTKRIEIEINIEGKLDRLPYPKNAPIPRVGEWILSPINTGYMLKVIDVAYQYHLYDMHITINTEEYKDGKTKRN